MSRIDIIIPVYRGVAETRACIDSVLAATHTQAAEIVVVNDASPEPAIADYLAALSANGSITLLTNASNLGFVATCNRAMQLHAARDVVLLNSDTVVADGWLDRMVACAAATPNTASVTPFSNNATLCSYPRIAISNPLAPGVSVGALDAMFARVNAGRFVEIPTGVGFCMLMTRAAIDVIGIFDAQAFGRGYGEENDWCMRATARGFTHLLCGDVFVYHQGEVSFGGDSDAGKQVAQAVIDARYPAYREDIAAHLAADPARALRRRVDLTRLATSTRPRLLFITHDRGGITEKDVNTLAAKLSESMEVLLLNPFEGQSLSLRWVRQGEAFEAYVEDRQDPLALLQLLRVIGISRTHLHHVDGLPMYLRDIHRELGAQLETAVDELPQCMREHLPDVDVQRLSEAAFESVIATTTWHAREPSRSAAPRHDTGVTSITVAFNPDPLRLAAQLAALRNQVDQIVIVDNGSMPSVKNILQQPDIAALVGGSPQISFIVLEHNEGVASGFNIGIEAARGQGAKFVLLLDHDSVPASGMVGKLVSGFEQAIGLNPAISVAAVGPRIVDSRDARQYPFIRLGWLRNQHLRCAPNNEKLIACDFLISSGALIAMSTFDKIGDFDDTLFIDSVDMEWCYRARAKDCLLFGVCDATLDHQLGDQRRVILNLINLVVHSPTRTYYQTRNRILLYRRAYVPLKWKLKDVLRMTAKFIATMLFVAPRLTYLRMTLLAIGDGLANRGGRLPDRQ